MDHKVNVIIPVYNREKLICRCLDSVWAQSYRPLRVIVVDNNSEDKTRDVVSSWMSEHGDDDSFEVELLSESVPGASAARNRGLREADGVYTFFFDSDDEMLPGLIEKAVAAAEADGADIVMWKAELVNLDGSVTYKPYYESDFLRRHMYNGLFATQIYMGRTELFLKVGGWEERAKVWNDWELGVRILLADPKISSIPEVLVRIHSQRESITGEAFSHRKGDWERTLEIVDSDIDSLAGAERKRLHRMTDYRRVILAAHYRREGSAGPARELLNEVLGHYGMADRLRLRMLYHYTSGGGRGAYYFWQS